MKNPVRWLAVLTTVASVSAVHAELKTWDGRHSIDQIEVTVVYFVPLDCEPLPDWRDRVEYFCKRIKQFHQREFAGQSKLETHAWREPFRSKRATEQLRDGDADSIFFKTMGEVDRELKFAETPSESFPILLVLSEINWRPLDDFYRLKPNDHGELVFDGNYHDGRHFPGASAGGSRATYLADRGCGWGLVSGDGWRVPYCGTDCVVYHEGVGHSIGLPHPDPINPSVMGTGQYKGWISESWLDEEQKIRLGFQRGTTTERARDFFSSFTALPDAKVPKPREPVALEFVWPEDCEVKSLHVRLQTNLRGPWITLPTKDFGETPNEPIDSVPLGSFDRPTPVSYRVDAVLEDARAIELWGYFQVRNQTNELPLPDGTIDSSPDLMVAKEVDRHVESYPVDLFEEVDVARDRVAGTWTFEGSTLTCSKGYGVRLELPSEVPEEYELIVIVEPLDVPHGLILGQLTSGRRFQTLLNYRLNDKRTLSALENVDGKDVSSNETTVEGEWFLKDRLSQVICTVRKDRITVACDGRQIIDWTGSPDRLSLGKYWETPHEGSLFLGAYDCAYRFHRVSLRKL